MRRTLGHAITMSPYQILRRYAMALQQGRPNGSQSASFLSGFELGMKMMRMFPKSAERLMESIDIEAHDGDNLVGQDTLLSIVNEIAQQRTN